MLPLKVRTMRDVMEMLVRRFLPAETLEAALMQFARPSRVRELRKELQPTQSLLFTVAEEFGFDTDALVIEVARILAMDYCPQPLLPTKRIVELSGYSAEELQKHGVLPQQVPTREGAWELLISDPEQVSVQEYRARGVEVRLCCARKIAKVWQEYRSLSTLSPRHELVSFQLDALLSRAINDAESLGAQEIFIGHPTAETYEFVAENSRYTGRIHSAVYHTLQRELQSLGSKERTLEDSQREVSLALTKNFSHSVIYLSWEPLEGAQTVDAQGTVNSDRTVNIEFASESASVLENDGAVPVNTSEEFQEESSTVLVVDDDEQFAEILLRVLQRRGYQTHFLADAQFAFEGLKGGEIQADLIISDVHLPATDGGDFLQLLRKHNIGIPVILLTSDEDEGLEAELVSRGADAFLRKHEDVRVLLAWCKNLLLRGAMRKAEGFDNAA